MRRRPLIAAVALAPFAAQFALARAAHAQTEPTIAQLVLPKERLVIVTHDGTHHAFDVEMARTPEQQVTGLMFRTSVSADGGMLFVWPVPQESEMWMKNTLVPLDMVFIEADGTIRHIAENTVPHSLAIIDSHGKVAATLELQGGITAKLGIVPGDKVLGKPFGTAATG
jgi:hypothetical protein